MGGALQELTGQGAGSKEWEKLGKLASRDRTYVAAVMETAQTVRHRLGYRGRKLLSEAECRERAKALIEAYAKTISM